MASSSEVYTKEAYSLIKRQITLRAAVNFGASGVPTLEKWQPSTVNPPQPVGYSAASTSPAGVIGVQGFQGVTSVAQNATGDYTFTFNTSFQRLLDCYVTWQNPSANLPPAAQNLAVVASGGSYGGTNVNPGGGNSATVEVLTLSVGTSPAATNPGNGEVGIFAFVFDDSGSI